MKLKDTELAVISAVLFDADLPIASLARDSGISPSTARATLAKLIERGILRYYPFVNVYPLGYIPYQFYFTPAPAQEDVVRKYINEHPAASWLIKSSGPYKYCSVFLCKTPFEYTNVMHEMASKLGAVFVSRATAIQTRHTVIEPKFLFLRGAQDRELTWQSIPFEGKALDTIDKKILFGLVNQKHDSHRDLARKLKIASSTFNERIKALHAHNIISGFIYIVNFAALGCLSYKILVSAKTLHPKFRSELRELIRQEKHAYAFTECIGPWDFEVDLRCFDEAVPQAFIKTIHKHFGKLVSAIEVLMTEERIKLSCYPFLER